jgi:two-component system, NarL family, sensor kinase
MIEMRKFLTGLVFTLTFFAAIPVKGQNLDSLENIFKTRKLSAGEQLKLCDDLSWFYLSVNCQKSKYWAKEGIAVALNSKDNKMSGTLFRNLGVACYQLSEMDSALIYFKSAEKYARLAQDDNLVDVIDLARANLYNRTGNFQQALSIYLIVLPRSEQKNNPARTRQILGNIGALYCNMHNYEQAKKYYLQCVPLCEKDQDDWTLGHAFNGLADVYSKTSQFDKALEYAQKAIAAGQRCGDNENLSLIYQSVSQIYYVHFKDSEKAIEAGLKGLAIARESLPPAHIAAMLNNLSDVFYYTGDYQKCLDYALEAIRTDTADFDTYGNASANVVRAGIQLSGKGNALKYFAAYDRINQKRITKGFLEKIAEMETRYHTEKKDLQIIVLEKQTKMQALVTIGSGIILLLLIILIYFRYKITKRNEQIAEQKIVQLEKEKQLTSAQSLLEGENAERKRLARDLHDGLGGMLSVVKLNLVNMKGNTILPESDVPVFHNALEMLDESIRELRRVAHNLMPESLMRYGLKPGLSDFCRSISHVRLHYFGEERRLEEKYEIATFRVVQELVNNAIKHSEASQINVQVIIENDRLNLVIQDNGKGFDPAGTDTTRTTGLSSIRSRVESLGGHMELISSPGKGTEVQIDFKI